MAEVLEHIPELFSDLGNKKSLNISSAVCQLYCTNLSGTSAHFKVENRI